MREQEKPDEVIKGGGYLENLALIAREMNMNEVAVPLSAYCEMLNRLRAQEPMNAIVVLNGIDGSGGWWYQCPSCKMEIQPRDKACRFCGRAVKWE